MFYPRVPEETASTQPVYNAHHSQFPGCRVRYKFVKEMNLKTTRVDSTWRKVLIALVLLEQDMKKDSESGSSLLSLRLNCLYTHNVSFFFIFLFLAYLE